MIERLTIHNFQAHELQEIDLDPRITCIVGPSDIGKSAIVRALWWLASNRPAGKAFLQDGKKEVAVEVVVDGHTIIRKRGERNLYVVDGEELEAFGNDVPAEVAKLLNLRRENFQLQLDSPFWFCLTPGQVSRELNAIVNLGAIDESLGFLAKELRHTKAEVMVLRSQLQQAKARATALDWVPEMSRDLEALTTLKEENLAKSSRIDSLRRACLEVSSLQETCNSLSRDATEGRRLLGVAQTALNSSQKVEELRDLLTQITQEGGKLCRLRKEVKRKGEELQRRTGGRCPLCGSPNLSPSSLPTGTCHSSRPRPGRLNRTGSRPRPALSGS